MATHLPSQRFASASRDGTVRIWNMVFNYFHGEFHGYVSFLSQATSYDQPASLSFPSSIMADDQSSSAPIERCQLRAAAEIACAVAFHPFRSLYVSHQ